MIRRFPRLSALPLFRSSAYLLAFGKPLSRRGGTGTPSLESSPTNLPSVTSVIPKCRRDTRKYMAKESRMSGDLLLKSAKGCLAAYCQIP